MPILNQQSIDRIAGVVRTVETRFEDATVPDAQSDSQDLRWFKLTEPLDADAFTARANPGRWNATANDGDGEMTDEDDYAQTVLDTTHSSGATKGDWVLCRPIGSTNGAVWEIVGFSPRDRYGKTDAALTAGGKVTVSLWSYDADEEEWVDSDEDQEEVYDSFWYQGLTLPSYGVFVKIRYCPENSRWEIVEVPRLEGTMAADLNENGYANATVFGYAMKVYASYVQTSAINSGTKVIVGWNTQNKRWEVVGRAC